MFYFGIVMVCISLGEIILLCNSGIVVMRKEQKWMYYSISEEGVAYAMEYLQSLMTVKSSDKDEPCCDK